MSDNFDKLRFIGYCWAKLPPEDVETNFEDFVQYAKFQLCATSKRLMKDPIWDEYTAEEILIEYYALLFHNNEEQATKLLQRLNGISDNDYDWVLQKAEEFEAQLGEEEEDVVSFDPSNLGD